MPTTESYVKKGPEVGDPADEWFRDLGEALPEGMDEERDDYCFHWVEQG